MSRPDRAALRRRAVLILIPAACVVAPLLLALALEAGYHNRPHPGGDGAPLELAAWKASRGEILLGPYSRMGWHHPGPLFFYLLAPFYVASGKTATGLGIGMGVLNLAALLACFMVVQRHGDAGQRNLLPYLVLVAAVAFANPLGRPTLLTSYWNPHATVFPMAAFGLLAAALGTGSAASLVGLVVAGSFLVQTHVGTAPTVALLGALSLVMAARATLRQGRPFASLNGWWRAVLLAAGAAALLWALPLWEQLTSARGNLSDFLAFVTSRAGDVPLETAARLTAKHLLFPIPLALGLFTDQPVSFPSESAAAALALLGALAAALIFGYRRAARRGSRFAASLCLISCVGLVAAVVSATQIRGRALPYLVIWCLGVGIFAWLALALAFGPSASSRAPRWRRRAVVVGQLLLLGLAAAVTTHSVGAHFRQFADQFRLKTFPYVEATAVPLLTSTAEFADAPGIHLHHSPGTDYAYVAKVVLSLLKMGLPVSVDRRWARQVGPELVDRPDDRLEVWFGETPPDAVLIGRSERLAIFARHAALADRGLGGERRAEELAARAPGELAGSWDLRPGDGAAWTSPNGARVTARLAQRADHLLELILTPAAPESAGRPLTITLDGNPLVTLTTLPQRALFRLFIPGARVGDVSRIEIAADHAPTAAGGAAESLFGRLELRILPLPRAAPPPA